MIYDVCIVGGGPCGLSAAIAIKEKGFSYVVLEKGNVVDTISRYPTHQTFFSTSEKLEIGGVPFVNEERKPKRIHALTYYREVVKRKELQVNTYEKVISVAKESDQLFCIKTKTQKGQEKVYHSRAAIIATGYYDHPNMMGVKGEELPHVFHYFKEGHPFFNEDIVVIGGKNSAIDTALELQKSGARVTVLYRGKDYSKSIKPWVLPEFTAQVSQNNIRMEFNAVVKEITEDFLFYEKDGKTEKIKADFVFAMTGYHPDHSFLRKMGVAIDEETGRPVHHPDTMETNVENIFICGVIAAGNNANEIFIENGRFHGELIAKALSKKINLY